MDCIEVTFDMVREEFLPNTVTRNGRPPRYTRENFQAYLRNPEAYLAFEKASEKQEKSQKIKSELPEPTITPYSITVRHGESFAQRIKKLACSWIHSWITNKNTPVAVDKKKGNEEKEVFTVHFNRLIESGEAIAGMLALDPPLKPAIHEDLIAFGTDHKEVQREFPVAQLGSSWVRPAFGRMVSCLSRDDSVRGLYLGDWYGEWLSNYRFLAVRA